MSLIVEPLFNVGMFCTLQKEEKKIQNGKKMLCICHYQALELYYQAHVWTQDGIKYQQHLNQIPYCDGYCCLFV